MIRCPAISLAVTTLRYTAGPLHVALLKHGVGLHRGMGSRGAGRSAAWQNGRGRGVKLPILGSLAGYNALCCLGQDHLQQFECHANSLFPKRFFRPFPNVVVSGGIQEFMALPCKAFGFPIVRSHS